MTYDTAQVRGELLGAVAQSIDGMAQALAALTSAYELLDESTAERLEEDLFGPVQAAYGRARRTYASFAERSGLPARAFAPAPERAPSRGVHGLVEDAVAAVEDADAGLAVLQDSMMPVEVGDAELRAGLAEVRRLLARVPAGARAFTRSAGR
jgi:hypothetical protein